MGREEMIGAALRTWEQAAIEEALGEDAAAVLSEAIRLVELRARVPRYQRDMLRYLAQRDGTSVDQVLARELEDVACAHSEELAAAEPGLALALGGRRVRPRPPLETPTSAVLEVAFRGSVDGHHIFLKKALTLL